MNITVTKRGSQSKGERKKRLRQGFVPGSIYGKGLTPVTIEVPVKAIADVLMAASGLNTVIDLTIEGNSKKHTVLVDNLTRDPITRGFINVGLHQIKKGDKVTAHIPIQLIGEPSDVTLNGALLEQILESIAVLAQPADLPPHLEVDVSQLKIGDVLRVADLPHNSKFEYASPEDQAIASVHVSRIAQDVAATEAAATEAADETAAAPSQA
jgi:large subunit ribosomal protein L25